MDPVNVSIMSQREIFPPQTPVGMAYVPLQRFGQVYDPGMAFRQGTVFPELDMPWYGSRAFSAQHKMMEPAAAMNAVNGMDKGNRGAENG